MANLKKTAATIAEKLLPKADEAAEILAKIDTPEKAIALSGKERETYLNALEAVHGPQDARRKAMGFGDETYYHGTTHNKPIDKFDSSKAKSGQLFGRGNYVTTDLDEANVYTQVLDHHSGVPREDVSGSIYPLKIREGNSYNILGYADPKVNESFAARFSKDKANYKQDLLKSEDAYQAQDYMRMAEPDPTEYSKILVDNGYNSVNIDNKAKNIINKKDIRSVNAAFDPRFKDSPYIMSATSSGNIINKLSPMGLLGKGAKIYDKYINEPTDAAATAIASKITDATAPRGKFTETAAKNFKSMATPALAMGLSMVAPDPFMAGGKALKFGQGAAKLAKTAKEISAGLGIAEHAAGKVVKAVETGESSLSAAQKALQKLKPTNIPTGMQVGPSASNAIDGVKVLKNTPAIESATAKLRSGNVSYPASATPEMRTALDKLFAKKANQ